MEPLNRLVNDRVEEALRDRVDYYDNQQRGWLPLGVGNNLEDTGLALDDLRTVSKPLRDYATSNPWHIRGAQLRHSYVFGRGMSMSDVKRRAQTALDDPHNKETLFSVEGYMSANMALFTDGQFFVSRDLNTDRFTIVPLGQITGVETNPDDDTDIWFVQRSWTSNGTNRREWIPLSRHRRTLGRVPSTRTVQGVRQPVAQDKVMYIKRGALRPNGWTWAIPDSFGAYVWTQAYGGYLQDNAKLVHSLSKIAYSITRKNGVGTGTNTIAAQIQRPGVGGIAEMGEGNTLSGVGVPSAQVNFNHGQPLIAAVAASFGVPVIALLSSPGATGGSYGAASTLDSPTVKGFEALQDSWKNFYEEILRDLGSKDAVVEFPSIENDPPFRQITALATLKELNILWPDEVRAAAADILDIELTHDDLPPEPDPVVPGAGGGVVSAQGVAGAIPGGQEQGVTDHELDASA